MTASILCPAFNWKNTDQLRVWDQFQAKVELWLAGEKVDKPLQYTKIVLMLGDKGLSRWTIFKLSEDDKKDKAIVFKAYRDSLGKDISYRTSQATLYNSLHQEKGETIAEVDI